MNYLLDDQKRVVGVAWYSAITWPGDIFPNGALAQLDGDGVSLTPLGEHWIGLEIKEDRLE